MGRIGLTSPEQVLDPDKVTAAILDPRSANWDDVVMRATTTGFSGRRQVNFRGVPAASLTINEGFTPGLGQELSQAIARWLVNVNPPFGLGLAWQSVTAANPTPIATIINVTEQTSPLTAVLFTTVAAHGLAVGQKILISGLTGQYLAAQPAQQTDRKWDLDCGQRSDRDHVHHQDPGIAIGWSANRPDSGLRLRAGLFLPAGQKPHLPQGEPSLRGAGLFSCHLGTDWALGEGHSPPVRHGQGLYKARLHSANAVLRQRQRWRASAMVPRRPRRGIRHAGNEFFERRTVEPPQGKPSAAVWANRYR